MLFRSKDLMQKDGSVLNSSYLVDAGGRSSIEIQMDISYNPKKVIFTYPNNGVKTNAGNDWYESSSFIAVASSAELRTKKRTDGQVYSLDHLTAPIVKGGHIQGTIHDLVISDIVADSVFSYCDSSTAIINNVSISDASITYVISNNNGGTISNCSLDNATTSGAGFVGTNTGKISNCSVTNAMIGGDGFVGTNGYGSSTMIENCNVINAQIAGNGFAGTNNNVITDCHVYADNAVYSNYLNAYIEADRHYVPNANTVDTDAMGDSDNKLRGYNLVTIGLPFNGTTPRANVAGFAGSSSGTITACSVTGKVYGISAAGFAYTVGRGSVNTSYANTLVTATASDGTSNGFASDLSYGIALSQDHCLGIVKGSKGTGFVSSLGGGNVSGCYTAVWNAKGCSSYYPFYFTKRDRKSVV